MEQNLNTGGWSNCHAASPSVLEHEFNLRWQGRSISNQAAWGWLNSRSIPTQDKWQVLAEWLKVEPEVLRFGVGVRLSVQAHRKRWDEGVGYFGWGCLTAAIESA